MVAMATPAALGEYLSPSEAGRRVGVSSARIIQLARAGKLPCIETTLGRLLRPADVDEYARTRQRRRRGQTGQA